MQSILHTEAQEKINWSVNDDDQRWPSYYSCLGQLIVWDPGRFMSSPRIYVLS